MSESREFHPPGRILLGPGPSPVPARVLAAMAAPVTGHLDPQFLQLMNSTQSLLRTVFRTENQLTLPVSGTGSAGMETCLVNLIEPDDRVLVCVNGVFGQRMADVAARAGGVVTVLERPWGEVFDLHSIEKELARCRPKIVAIVHAETSTGACQPLTGLGQACRRYDALLLVDAVTSLGGVPLETDAWQIDAVYSGTQKCLSVPPGLSPISFGPRAVAAIQHRKRPVQSWYFDLKLVQRYWENERIYHHTAPISMIYALHEGLRIIEEEGLGSCWRRHLVNHSALKAGLGALAIEFSAVEGHQLPTLNAVRVPTGIDEAAVRSKLLAESGIEIGGGLGELKGKIWRIGLMGHGSQANNVLVFLAALEQSLLAQNYQFQAGASVAAANQYYRQHRGGE